MRMDLIIGSMHAHIILNESLVFSRLKGLSTESSGIPSQALSRKPQINPQNDIIYDVMEFTTRLSGMSRFSNS